MLKESKKTNKNKKKTFAMYFKLGLIIEILQLQSVVINSFLCVYTCLPLNHFLSTTLRRDNMHMGGGGNLISKMASFEGL